MQTRKFIFAVVVCTSLLGACGLKGPLYLPGEDPQAKTGAEQIPEDDDLITNNKKDKDSGPG